MSTEYTVFLLLSYLLGSIPFGFLVVRWIHRTDIRSEGSGNIGATNVLRSKGPAAGIITLLLDAFKGAAPVLYGLHHFDWPFPALLGGCLAVLGHMFPVFLKLRGGKGVATLVGVMLIFSPTGLALFLGLFLANIALTRLVSVGSLLGAWSLFFFILFTRTVEEAMILFVVVVLITLRHRANIQRIMAGTERRLSRKKDG